MRHGFHFGPALGSALLAVLAIAGCGSSSLRSSSAAGASGPPSTAAGTASTRATGSPSPPVHEPRVDIPVKGPTQLKPVSRRFSCDGGDVSLPLNWGKGPPGTVEFDLFAYNYLPDRHERLVPVWALAGLKPGVRNVAAGQPPPGAIVGRNRYGQARYSLCPPRGRSVLYEVLLYALPRRIPAKPGFDPEAITNQAQRTAESEGSLLFSYKRR